jgi:transposase
VCFFVVVVVVVGVFDSGGFCRDGSKISRSNSSLEQPYPSPTPSLSPTAKNLKRKKKKVGTHVRRRRRRRFLKIFGLHIHHLEVGTTVVGRLPGLAG